MLENKKKRWKEEEEAELRTLRKESNIWKYINKRRRRKEVKMNNIKSEDWRKHFQKLLEGIKEDGKKSQGYRKESEGVRGEEDCEEEVEDREIHKAMKRMKKGKAAGVDGIPMEAWLYGGSTIKEGLVEIINQVWKEGDILKDWRKSVIVPIHKKGDQEKVENYRGISLLCTAYKIYVEVLRSRLEEEIEEKNLIPESQSGFRKGRGTIDNIFILNHMQREKEEKEEKNRRIYAVFVDLKAAFDTVKREKLWRILTEKGINEKLIRRIKKIYEETNITIRTKEGLTSAFRTTKGLRQRCVLSPLLFNMYIADLDRLLKERGIGGVRLVDDRIWTLAYADDMVLLAKNREALMDMMNTLKRFLKERELILSVEKTKVIVFNGKRKGKKEIWKWGSENLEEVTSFKYLGFTFNNKGDYTDHIKELEKKGRIAANKV